MRLHTSYPIRLCLWASLLGALLLCASSIQAQSLPTGGRTATMGGAATAAGKDSAMPLLNPAGLARIPQTTLSLSTSLYTQSVFEIPSYTYPNGVDPGVGPSQIQADGRTSDLFDSFPSAVSLLLHLGGDEQSDTNSVLAMSIMTPSATHQFLEGSSLVTIGSNRTSFENDARNFKSTLWTFGPSYAYRTGALHIGASLFVEFHPFTFSNKTDSLFYDQSIGAGFISSVFTGNSKGHTLGARPVLGVQYDASYRLSFGASCAFETVHLDGEQEGTSSAETNAPNNASSLETSSFTGTRESRRPTTLRTGLRYTHPGVFTLSLDAGMRLELTDAFKVENTIETTRVSQQAPPVVESIQSTVVRDANAAYNLAAGVEVPLSKSVLLRAGASWESDPSILREDAVHQLSSDIDLYGGTVGIGLTNPIGETSFGLLGRFGEGETVVFDGWSKQSSQEFFFTRTKATYYDVMFLISGTVSFSEMKDRLQKELDTL